MISTCWAKPARSKSNLTADVAIPLRALALLTVLLLAAGCATAGPGRPEPHSGAVEPTVGGYGYAGDFITPQKDSDAPIWGVRNGIVVGIPPARIGFGRNGGPRGLIRVGFEENGKLYFINFLADAPITTDGRVGQSELDASPYDRQPGIRIFAYPSEFVNRYNYWRDRELPRIVHVATIKPAGIAAVMDMVFRYEKFPNGAQPYFVVAFRADRPREVAFFAYREPGSAELKRNVLSSTFGNLTRCRQAFLRDRVVDSRELWPRYRGYDFAPIQPFYLPELRRNRAGDVVFAVRPNEERPWEGHSNYPHPYRMTQYWRVPRDSFDDTLGGWVNGRYMFWKTSYPVPGGISYENVGVASAFKEGQLQIFGYHLGDPEELFR